MKTVPFTVSRLFYRITDYLEERTFYYINLKKNNSLFISLSMLLMLISDQYMITLGLVVFPISNQAGSSFPKVIFSQPQVISLLFLSCYKSSSLLY